MDYKNDLIICDLQYSVIHKNVSCFKLWEKVFLKSNPEFEMTVCSIGDSITVSYVNEKNTIYWTDFPPECLLQYKFAGLVTYNKKHCVSLN